MSEADRNFWSEYTGRSPARGTWGEWTRLGGTAPVTYQEACAEVLSEMEHDKTARSGIEYTYRIVDGDGHVVMSGTELAQPQVDLQRAARIVKRIEEEVNVLKRDIADFEVQLIKAGENRRWYEIGELSEKYRVTQDKITDLEAWLALGDS